jgi:hypothetical protein
MMDQATLERGYRRLLACYPRSFRQDNEDEMLAVLMAAAEEGQTRVGLAEAADLIGGAVRMRLWPAAPRPAAVRTAVRLMCAGAATELVVILAVVMTMGRVQAAVAARYPADVHATLVYLGFYLAVAPVIAGLWLWLAWANGQGHDWARILSVVALLRISIGMLILVALDAAAFAPADTIAVAIEWALGLASVVLVFTPASCRYYRPPVAAAQP